MSEEIDIKGLKALIDLLDDPDEVILNQVKETITSFGIHAIPVLEESWENIFEPRIQQHIEAIIHRIQMEQLRFELTNWQMFYSNDLLKGYLLITRYQYPELNESEMIKQLEQIKWDVWLELNESLTALEKINVVNHVMFDLQKFSSNRLNPAALQNYYINTLLETRRGNPLSMGILYLIICQKLDIPVYGVNLPEHFILAYTREIREDDTVYHKNKRDVLFYINPFKKGTMFTRKEVEIYLLQLKIAFDPSYFLPCDNVTIIKRLIMSLVASYQYSNLTVKVKELEELAGLL